MICHGCGGEVKVGRLVSRRDECPHCGYDLHCCLNCNNYDPAAHNRCREPQAEWVTDREKANFCDFFMPNSMNAAAKVKKVDDARSAFENLFKK